MCTTAADPYPSSRWSDLPSDILNSILQLLELPEALSVASVCTSWSSAAAANGVPCSHTPWLMSWSRRLDRMRRSDFRSLIDPCKVYDVTLSQGRSLSWCGSSHGWLVAADELSNLLLYNPFTFATIPLPPITDFDCVEAVRDSAGNIVEYLAGKINKKHYDVKNLGRWFYLKAVLSCAPSQDGNYTAMLIHWDSNMVSFTVAGEGRWRSASKIPQGSDWYADVVHHRGRFFTLTLRGVLEMWDLDGSCEPTKLVFSPRGDGKYRKAFLRFLVSAPWGDLLQINFLWSSHGTKRIRAQIRLVDVVKNELVKLRPADVFQKHTVFVGQNHSACLPSKNFPELKPNCIYFTRTRLRHQEIRGFESTGVGGVGIYNLQSEDLEEAFPCYDHDAGYLVPSAVWITPNL